jgi:hypothetical protein
MMNHWSIATNQEKLQRSREFICNVLPRIPLANIERECGLSQREIIRFLFDVAGLGMQPEPPDEQDTDR